MKIFLRNIQRLGIIIVGMSGYRIDRLLEKGEKKYFSIIWFLGILLSVLFTFTIVEYYQLAGALTYFVVAWLFYYVGNTFILKTNFRKYFIKHWGEEKTYRIYEVILGLMFANQALSLGAVIEENFFRWPKIVKFGVIDEIGILLICIGLLVKTWATMIVGLDIYYYKDMFLGKSTSSFAVKGPYRILSNPMYGIGNIQLYGLALFHFSIHGLIVALISHISIYAFYFIAERPAIIKLYGEVLSYD